MILLGVFLWAFYTDHDVVALLLFVRWVFASRPTSVDAVATSVREGKAVPSRIGIS